MINTNIIRKLLHRYKNNFVLPIWLCKIAFGILFITTCIGCIKCCQIVMTNINESKEVVNEYPTVSETTEIIVPVETEPEVEKVKYTFPKKFDIVPLDNDLKEYIYTSAIKANIPPEIIFSMAKYETNYNADVASKTNDHGMFQINICNFERLAQHFNMSYSKFCKKIYDPYINTDCMIYILTEYRDRYGSSSDNWHHVLMRYNMGPGGAKKKFNEGIYTSNYSRSIISYAQDTFNLTSIDL